MKEIGVKQQFKRLEFLIAIIIAILLIGTLLSKQFLAVPLYITPILLTIFIIIKAINIIKQHGTILEDYVALAIIILFGITYIIIGQKLNPIIITVVIITLLYSVGIIPWVKYIMKSKKVVSFILSYAIFIIMIIFLFTGIFFSNNTQFATASNDQVTIKFEEALYFSTITFTTVGYGDLTPIGKNRLIASIEAITGVILNIAFIGYILASRRFK